MLLKKDKEKILFFRESVFKVAELIFNYPNRSFYLREIAKKTCLSTTAVTQALKDLENFMIITIEKTSLSNNVKANLESASYQFYKIIFNLYRLERYDMIKIIQEAYNAKTIVLFGSFAKGEDIEESDLDLLIITNQKEIKDISDFLLQCEKELNRTINIHQLNSLDKSSSEFKNTIANGIVLFGYLKII